MFTTFYYVLYRRIVLYLIFLYGLFETLCNVFIIKCQNLIMLYWYYVMFTIFLNYQKYSILATDEILYFNIYKKK